MESLAKGLATLAAGTAIGALVGLGIASLGTEVPRAAEVPRSMPVAPGPAAEAAAPRPPTGETRTAEAAALAPTATPEAGGREAAVQAARSLLDAALALVPAGAGRITGVVCTREGAPVEGVRITATARLEAPRSFAAGFGLSESESPEASIEATLRRVVWAEAEVRRLRREVVSAADGSFALDGLPEEATVSLEAWREGFHIETLDQFHEWAAGDAVTLIASAEGAPGVGEPSERLPPAGEGVRIRIRLALAAGAAPPEEMAVRAQRVPAATRPEAPGLDEALRDGGDPIHLEQTGPGEGILERPAAGTYAIAASVDGATGPIAVVAAERGRTAEVTLTAPLVERAAPVRVRVRSHGPDGAPLPRAYVDLSLASGFGAAPILVVQGRPAATWRGGGALAGDSYVEELGQADFALAPAASSPPPADDGVDAEVAVRFRAPVSLTVRLEGEGVAAAFEAGILEPSLHFLPNAEDVPGQEMRCSTSPGERVESRGLVLITYGPLQPGTRVFRLATRPTQSFGAELATREVAIGEADATITVAVPPLHGLRVEGPPGQLEYRRKGDRDWSFVCWLPVRDPARPALEALPPGVYELVLEPRERPAAHAGAPQVLTVRVPEETAVRFAEGPR